MKSTKAVLHLCLLLAATSFAKAQVPEGAIDPKDPNNPIYDEFVVGASVLGGKVVNISEGEYLLGKTTSSAEYNSEFFKDVSPFSPDEINVGQVDSVPFFNYNEVSGRLTATLPSVGIDGISLVPSYFAPSQRHSPVDRVDFLSGNSGNLGVGWHLGLGHLVVQRRTYTARCAKIEPTGSEYRKKWVSSGWETVNYVDSNGRSSAFAKEYLSDPNRSAIGQFEYPGSIRSINLYQGAKTYRSLQRPTTLIDASGRILHRPKLDSSENAYFLAPRSDNLSDTSCQGTEPATGNYASEAKIVRDSQGNITHVDEYGWFNFSLITADGSRVEFAPSFDSIELANSIATKTILEEDLTEQFKTLKSPVFFHPVSIIKPNGHKFNLTYYTLDELRGEVNAESVDRCARYTHCIPTRYLKSIEQVLPVQFNQPKLLMEYVYLPTNTTEELGAFEELITNNYFVSNIYTNRVDQNDTNLRIATFQYRKLNADNRYHLEQFIDAENRAYTIGHENSTGLSESSSHPWVKSITSPVGARTTLNYFNLDSNKVGMGVFFPRACDSWIYGQFLDLSNDVYHTPDRPLCDPVLNGASDYSPKRVQSISHSNQTITYDYQVVNSDAQSYAAFSPQADHLASDMALFRVIKSAVGDSRTSSEGYTRTTYYASYKESYANTNPSRRIGRLAGKPLIQTIEYTNPLGQTSSIRNEWLWELEDNKYSPIGGNPLTKKISAQVNIDKHASIRYKENSTFESVTYLDFQYNEENYKKFNPLGAPLSDSMVQEVGKIFAKPAKIIKTIKSNLNPPTSTDTSIQQNFEYVTNLSSWDKLIGRSKNGLEGRFQINLPYKISQCVMTFSSAAGGGCENAQHVLSEKTINYESFPIRGDNYSRNNLTVSSQNVKASDDKSYIKSLKLESDFTSQDYGYLSKESLGTGYIEKRYSNYNWGKPETVKNYNGTSTQLNAGWMGDLYQLESITQGVRSSSMLDKLGREVFKQFAWDIPLTTDYIEHHNTWEIKNFLGDLYSSREFLSVKKNDIWGKEYESKSFFDQNAAYGATNSILTKNYTELGILEESVSPKGGTTKSYVDIFGRPTKTEFRTNEGLVKKQVYAYTTIASTPPTFKTVIQTSNCPDAVGDSCGAYSKSSHTLITTKDHLGRMLEAKQCSGLTENCSTEFVGFAYEPLTNGLVKQTISVKKESGEIVSQRIRKLDRLGNLIEEDNPEIGVTKYRYNDIGQVSEVEVVDSGFIKSFEFDQYTGLLLAEKVNENVVSAIDYNASKLPEKIYTVVGSASSVSNAKSSRRVEETINYEDSTNRIKSKTVTIPKLIRGPEDLRPRYIQDYNDLKGRLKFRWNHSVNNVNNASYQLELINQSLSSETNTVRVIFNNIITNSFELTSTALREAINAQLGNNGQSWITELNNGANPISSSSTYEWRVHGFNAETFEPFASSQKSILTNECQILEFEAVTGYQQGPLIKWDTRNCEGLTTAVLTTTHTVPANLADPNNDCRIDDGVFSGYKRGPQRAHFLYNGYNKADIIASEEGDSSSTPTWINSKECFGNPYKPTERLEEVSFRLSIREGGDGLIKDKAELLSSRNIIAKLDYDGSSCRIRNFQVKHGSGELAHNSATGQSYNDGRWTPPSTTWETVNCEDKYIELKVNAIDTQCDVNELLSVSKAGTFEANNLESCGNQGGASFQLEVREGASFDSVVIDESQVLEAMSVPQESIEGGCYISDFTASDGDAENKPKITWRTQGCEQHKVNLLYNAVQPGVNRDCQLRDYLFVESANGEAVEASFMYHAYTVSTEGVRIPAYRGSSTCSFMNAADAWLEIREDAGEEIGRLITDTPPINIAYSGGLLNGKDDVIYERSCGVTSFNVVDSTETKLPIVSWSTNCDESIDVNVKMSSRVSNEYCDITNQTWDTARTNTEGREAKIMVGGWGYAQSCGKINEAIYWIELVDTYTGEIINQQDEPVSNFAAFPAEKYNAKIPYLRVWNSDYLSSYNNICKVSNLSVQSGNGLVPVVDFWLARSPNDEQYNRSNCSNKVHLMFSSTDPLLPEQCQVKNQLIGIATKNGSNDFALDIMEASETCPAIESGEIWVEQYSDKQKLRAHTSMKNDFVTYTPNTQCGIQKFSVDNNNGLPIVTWSTNCNNRVSVRNRTTILETENAEDFNYCHAENALWDGNKSGSRSVDFMVGGWEALDGSSNICGGVKKAAFQLELFDMLTQEVIETSSDVIAEFNRVEPECRLLNPIVTNNPGDFPQVAFNANNACSAPDIRAEMFFEGWIGTQRVREQLNGNFNEAIVLNIMARTNERAAVEQGWVWVMVYKGDELIQRSMYKHVIYDADLNGKASDETPISPLSSRNPIEFSY